MTQNSETIGQMVQRLFPHGFMNNEYWLLLFSQNVFDVMDDASPAAQLLDEISDGKYSPPSNTNTNKAYTKLLRASKKTSENQFRDYIKLLDPNLVKVFTTRHKQYLVPPISPFDLFALTSTFLLKSGAYHHFEAALEAPSFNGRARAREPMKSSFIECEQINNWRQISESWYSYAHEEVEARDPFIGFIDQKFMGYHGDNKEAHPHNLMQYWSVILRDWDKPVYTPVKDQEKAPEWWDAAYSLMAIADLTAQNAGFKRAVVNYGDNDKLTSPWSTLAEMIINRVSVRAKDDDEEAIRGGFQNFKYVESLSVADRSFVNVMPKSRTAPLGCTLRCLSHNLANLPGHGIIRAGWAWASEPAETVKRNPVFNMLLIPYPYELHSTNFEATGVSHTNNPDCDDTSIVRWGSFRMSVEKNKPEDEDFIDFVSRLIREGGKRVGAIHAIVLPELALSRESIIQLRNRITANHPSIELICSGMREHPYKDGTKSKEPISVNGAYMASIDSDNREKTVQHEFFHEKHHRWRITDQQIYDYDLAPALDPSKVWWEDIRVVNRRLPFLVMRDEWSVTTLICEDLARNDPAKTVVESVGPNLVISLLMDGPQVPERWSARYATVLADDPGSSVLSMSSFGLINRSNKIWCKEGEKPLRSFALWRDDRGQFIPIELDEGNHASIVSISAYTITDLTMDGRSDNRSISLRLTGQRQIKDPNTEGYPPWGSSTK